MRVSRLSNFLFTIFVSPEAVVALLCLLPYYYFFDSLAELGGMLKTDAEIWKYLPTLTLGFSGVAFVVSSKIRAPLENFSNKALYEWPHYQLLVDRVLISLGFSVICGVASLAIWMLGTRLSAEVIGVVFLVATSVSATTALTMFLAQQRVRELVDRYGT